MTDNGYAWLMGWPLISLGLVLAAAGIMRRKPGWLYLGAALILPVSAYLAATPRFLGLGLAFPVLIALGGFAVKRGQATAAWLLLAPVILFMAWLARLVLGE